jgi:hypothetical protein
MARRLLFRRVGPFGVALTLWDVWRRIPPQHRRRLLEQARRHGPRLAQRAYEARRRPRPPR